MCKNGDFSDMGRKLHNQVSFIYLMRDFFMVGTLLYTRDAKNRLLAPAFKNMLKTLVKRGRYRNSAM